MSAMTKRERVQAALKGRPVDRVPVSAWGHDFLREWTAQGLAEATLESYRRFDWDFIKVNPRATYYAEAWGARYRPSGRADGEPELVEAAVRSAADLDDIGPIDWGSGPFGEQIEALRLIDRGLAGEAPFVQTVFSPLAVMSRLTGSTHKVRELLTEHPHEVERALEGIARTLAGYARACLEAGASGIFFATVEWGSRGIISPAEYARFGRPYDLQVLAAVADAPFNILHVCRAPNQLLWLLDYPVACFHWAAHETTNPGLGEVMARTGAAVAGGVDHEGALRDGTPEEVARQARGAIAETGGRRFLLAPACSVAPMAPEANLRALREAAERLP